jgi:hypothetical protein
MTIEELATLIAQNAKTKQWLNGSYKIDTPKGELIIGVKAFGLWVQRVQYQGKYDSVSEQKTQKAFKEEFIRITNALIA